MIIGPRVIGAVLAACMAAVLAEAGQDPAVAGAQTPTLPGGASQIQETHGDWRVACAQDGDRRLCSLIHQQVEKDSRQLVVGIELRATPGDTAEATLVLPFGVAVNQPVTLLLDDMPAMTQSFRTCLPVGCIVVLSFDTMRLAQLKQATVLMVTAATVTAGQTVSFKVPLNGFASGLARTVALSR